MGTCCCLAAAGPVWLVAPTRRSRKSTQPRAPFGALPAPGESDRLVRKLPQGPRPVDHRCRVPLAAQELLEVRCPLRVPLDLAAVQFRRAEGCDLGVAGGYRAGQAGRGQGVGGGVVGGVEGDAVFRADRFEIALAAAVAVDPAVDRVRVDDRGGV